MTTQTRFWEVIQQVLPNRWTELSHLYAMIEKVVRLDDEDREPVSDSTDVKWRRNVRNALQEHHGTGVERGERGLYRLKKEPRANSPRSVQRKTNSLRQGTGNRASFMHAITVELNKRASKHPIGKLQEIRTKLKALARQPGHDIFRPNTKTITDHWAFHYGGRSELQFNVGLENDRGIDELRHGVAFSFETNQTLPSIDILVPQVAVFNDYMRLHPELYQDMRMWHYRGNERSDDSMPGPIPPELVTEGIFVFMGNRQPMDSIDYEAILSDFDRLLPLYKYVVSHGKVQPTTAPTEKQFQFVPGCSVKAASTSTTLAEKELNINLRHNTLQKALYKQLVAKYGKNNVGTELPSGVGTSVDLVVRSDGKYWFYEIKTSPSPRACIREALGQLLEYSFWPGAQEAMRLVVVGETALDKDGKEYLNFFSAG